MTKNCPHMLIVW